MSPATPASAPAGRRCERRRGTMPARGPHRRGLCRAGADAMKARRLGSHADRLAAGVWHQPAVLFEWIAVGQSGSAHAGLGIHVTCGLTARKGTAHQDRPRVVAEVFRLIRPLGDTSAQILARVRHADMSGLRRMDEDMVRAAHPVEDPSSPSSSLNKSALFTLRVIRAAGGDGERCTLSSRQFPPSPKTSLPGGRSCLMRPRLRIRMPLEGRPPSAPGL